MDKYLTFQEFMNAEDADEMAAKLQQYGIPAVVEKSPELLGSEFIGQQYGSFVLLRIPANMFTEAQQALIDSTNIDMNTVDRSYMLFSLSDKELLDVVAKPDEWGAYNYKLAQQILKERQVKVDEQEVSEASSKHLEDIAQQRPLGGTWLFWGYFSSVISIAACFLSPRSLVAVYGLQLLPGLLGIIIGAIVLRTKKTLPDGSHILAYNDKARKHGRAMLLLGALAILLLVLLFFRLVDAGE